MADVKPIVLKSNGQKSELSNLDTMILPLLTSHPSGNAPTGYVYMYCFSGDKHIYQKDDSGTLTDLALAGGGGSGLTYTEVTRLNYIFG